MNSFVQLWNRVGVAAMFLSWSAAVPAVAQYAVEVVSYDAGATPATEFGTNLPFDVASAALGEPSRFIDDPSFPSVVSPFSPPFKRSQFVSVGEGGQLTLRLSHHVVPQLSGPEIGVFTNAGLAFDFANGVTASPVATFGVDSALVEVSEDGVNWLSLGETLFDGPTNGYADATDPFAATPGSVPSDFQQPFAVDLSALAGLPYADPANPDVLDVLAGSGGGTWLDLSGTGLAQVGYLRFSIADDGDPTVGLNFELDGVSIASDAMGAPTVPEPTTIGLAIGFLVVWTASGRRGFPRRV